MSDVTRRKFPRSPFLRPVCVTCRDFSKICKGVEVGEGGLAFSATAELEIGTAVVINFYLGTGQFHTLKSEIRNKSEGSFAKEKIYGISFVDIPLALKRQIRSFVARSSQSSKQQPSKNMRGMNGF